jgi:hypothetical protein
MGDTVDATISKESYDKYLQKRDNISNTRLRPENETFFDAMMSADMTTTPEGRKILETIKRLN